MLNKFMFSLSVILLLPMLSLGQITGTEFEVVQVHYGDYGDGYDLTGYVTYRMYVTVENEDDYLVAIYGLFLGDSLADESDFVFNFDCNLFQHELGSDLAGNLNCVIVDFPGFESLQYDSWFTVGEDCDNPGAPGATALAAAPTAWGPIADIFEGDIDGDYYDGGNVYMDDGLIFLQPWDTPGFGGPELRVLVGQFTTCGNIDACFDAQVFINQDQNNAHDTTLCAVQPNPCLDQALNPVVSIIDDIDCYGETATVEIGDGTGNGVIDYDLYADGVFLYDQTNFTFEDLEDSVNYYVAVMDAYGCRDTSEVFSLTMPDSLILTPTLDADVLCFGDLTAEICYTVTGGTPPYNMDIDGDPFVYPGCVEDLGCGDGDYTINVIDDNGCPDSGTVEVSCPALLEVSLLEADVTCNSFCNGTISGTVSGGTDTLNVVWTLLDPATTILDIDVFSGDDISVQDLCPGEYEVNITDSNGCVLTESYTIVEPDAITTAITTTDETCTGFCDGTITIEAFGGINAVPECEGGLTNLCGGFYICTTTDSNQCVHIDTVEIITPPVITYDTISLQDVTCFGACDGAVIFENLQGGSGYLSSVLLDNTGSETPLDNLCADLSPFTISIDDDSTGCNILVPDLMITEPDELVVIPSVTDITCFGYNNGIIDVTCVGGSGTINIISPEPIACPHTFENYLPGDYLVSVVDSMGCVDSTLVTILEPTVLDVSILSTVNVDCGGECEGSVEAEVIGGTPDANSNYNWFINGMPVQYPGGLSQLCAGDDQVLLVLDMNLCPDSVLFTITEPDPITLVIGSSDITCTGMCDGSLSVVPQGGVGDIEIEFSPDDIDPSNMCEGVYYILGSDSTGCFVQDSVLIGAEVITDMEVTIFTTPVTCWNEGDGTVTAGVTGGFLPINYQWDDPLGQTTVTAVGLVEEVYHVIITDSLGCTISATAIVEPSIGCFYIATALTPNGDAVNDEWLIGGMEYFPHADIQVFNRWGQVLFQSIGYDVPWDGTHNGRRLPIADYYYVIKFDENEEPITGTVTIKY